ncbi:hypothetical protein BDV96DRAFT_601187 [Lophiotrema nucula]|uniref:Uncharacterized protein n=1 Tax=Lophiotrema nucula TaxID=690887 RepID=A0A6A5Z2L7_9PLEO|nr:hypothetical protein BDV96DRAFT_601187 [Lophiotrema nucula]
MEVESITPFEEDEQYNGVVLLPQRFPSKILKYRKQNEGSHYLVRWQDTVLAREQIHNDHLQDIFTLRPYSTFGRPKPVRVHDSAALTEDFYVVAWRHSWELGEALFESGQLLHDFWTLPYNRASGVLTESTAFVAEFAADTDGYLISSFQTRARRQMIA